MTIQPPLDWRAPIIDTNGGPTSTFQRFWNQLRMSTVPSGLIALYTGTVPEGWLPCDGTNGTPNLPAYNGANFMMKS